MISRTKFSWYSLIHLFTIFSLSGFLFSQSANAQTADQFNSWWYYAGTYKVMPRTTIQTMYSWNRNEFLKNWQQSKLRAGAGFELNKHLKMAAGYEWVVLYPYGKFPISGKRTEHRVYEEVKFDTKIQQFGLSSSIKAEHRFVNADWKHRVRLQSVAKFPIWKKENKPVVGFSFYDQVILNTEKQPLGQYMAQNRIYGGFDVFINRSVVLGLGYMNHYVYHSKNKVENNHTVIFSVSHYLDFTKKKKSLAK